MKTPHLFRCGVVKVQKDRRIRVLITCTQRSGAAAAPVVVEPVVAPAPPAVVPVQATDAQAAIRVAVDRAPEEYVFAFPFLRNEVRIGEQVVKDVGIQDGLVSEFLAELVALDAVLFLGGGEV